MRPNPEVAIVVGMADVLDSSQSAAVVAKDDDDLWLTPLSGTGRSHEDAVRRLHEMLVRAAHFEVRRRATQLGLSNSSELGDVAMHAADDALVAILARLDSFERRSAFTTWAYKFAIHTAGVAVRKLAWHSRELPTSDVALARLESISPPPHAAAETREDLREVTAAIHQLTPRQREVVVALCVSGVPLDVLADRLGSTRGAVYKTLHDARARLREHLAHVRTSTTTTQEGIDHG